MWNCFVFVFVSKWIRTLKWYAYIMYISGKHQSNLHSFCFNATHVLHQNTSKFCVSKAFTAAATIYFYIYNVQWLPMTMIIMSFENWMKLIALICMSWGVSSLAFSLSIPIISYNFTLEANNNKWRLFKCVSGMCKVYFNMDGKDQEVTSPNHRVVIYNRFLLSKKG